MVEISRMTLNFSRNNLVEPFFFCYKIKQHVFRGIFSFKMHIKAYNFQINKWMRSADARMISWQNKSTEHIHKKQKANIIFIIVILSNFNTIMSFFYIKPFQNAHNASSVSEMEMFKSPIISVMFHLASPILHLLHSI